MLEKQFITRVFKKNMPVFDLASGTKWSSSTDFNAFTATTGGTTVIGGTTVVGSFASDDHAHIGSSLDLEVVDAGEGMIDNLLSQHVTSTVIETDKITAEDLEIEDELIYKGEKYEITDKFHKTGVTLESDEIDTTNKTIVVRNLTNGCRITNLQVRADNSAAFQATPAGPYPGLFFTDAWCSEQLAFVDDGHGFFQETDAQDQPIVDQYCKWGRLTSGSYGYMTKNGDFEQYVNEDGITINSGTGQSGSATAVIKVYDDAGTTPQTVIDNLGRFHTFRASGTSQVPVLSCWTNAATPVALWHLMPNGMMQHVDSHDDPTHANAGSGGDVSHKSVVASDSSLYVGNIKISYDANTHKAVFVKLKKTQIPKFFSDLGYSTQNLPQNYTTSNMSVQRYLALARDLRDDDSLHVSDVFPTANSTDWEVETVGGAAPTNLFEIHNLTGSAELSLESNTDVAQTSTKIKMKAESSVATEDRTYELMTDGANGDQFIIQCTTNQNGTKEGWRFAPDGAVSFACGQNPITNMNASNFQVRGSAWFRSTLKASGAIDASGGVTIPSGQTLLLNNVDQLALIATQAGQIATQAAQIATQAAQIAALQAAGGHTEYFRFLPSTEAGFKQVNPIAGNCLTLPDGYRRYTIVYGHGTNSNSATTFGLRVRLPPGVAVDGTIVELFTNHAFTHTGAYHVAFITVSSHTVANGGSGSPLEPPTRSIYDPATQTLITYAHGDSQQAQGAEYMIEGFSNGSGRGTVKFHYV